MNYEAIVVGAGPAGLAAATRLAQAGCRVLVLERESFGGPILNVEWIDGWPAPGERTAGAALSSELVNRAQAAGVEMKLAEVAEIEAYSGCLSVSCADGAAYTASAVVLAAGLRGRNLGVPGEDVYQGKGMIHCAMCDAGLYRDRAVAVCGAGDAGLIEALYLARFASKVYVIEAQPQPAAAAALVERARAEPKIELRCGERPVEVVGSDSGVTGIAVERAAGGARETLDVYGVLVHVGYEPDTAFAAGAVALDDSGYAEVDEALATDVRGVFAAGDLRAGSPRTVAAAIADGNAAADGVQRFLQALHAAA